MEDRTTPAAGPAAPAAGARTRRGADLVRTVLGAVLLTLLPVLAVPAATAAEPDAGLVVNGHELTATEEANVRWIADNTVPRLAGDRETRLTAAARVTWWTLKEGVLGLENPHGFSHCDGTRLDPLDACEPECCWQVGIAAIQPQTFDPARAEQVAEELYPGNTAADVLAHTAVYAGYPEGSAGYERITQSSGSFRNSWLVRNHGVGFALNAPQVEAECIEDSLSWCFGTGWDTTAKYAPDKTAAMGSIEDLRAILDGLTA
jgi:hypothetical protein